MFDFLSALFDTSSFPRRWDCGQWLAAHGWLHILPDLRVLPHVALDQGLVPPRRCRLLITPVSSHSPSRQTVPGPAGDRLFHTGVGEAALLQERRVQGAADDTLEGGGRLLRRARPVGEEQVQECRALRVCEQVDLAVVTDADDGFTTPDYSGINGVSLPGPRVNQLLGSSSCTSISARTRAWAPARLLAASNVR